MPSIAALSPRPDTCHSPKPLHLQSTMQLQSTTDTGMTFVGSVSGDITSLQTDVECLHNLLASLRADLGAEAHARGGELAALRQHTSTELADAIASLRQELGSRLDDSESQTTQWTHTLGQEVQALKPRLERVETSIPQHVTTQAVSEGRLTNLERALPALHRGLASMGETHTAKCAEMDVKLVSHREQHAAEATATAASNAKEIKRLEEHLESLRRQEAATKTAVSENLSHLDALIEKMTGMQVELQSKAKTADVQSLLESSEKRAQESLESTAKSLHAKLEDKVAAAELQALVEALEKKGHEKLERTARSIGEELAQKESVTAVKALADRANYLAAEMQASAAKAKQDHGEVSRKVDEVSQGLKRAAQQAESERAQCSESLGVLAGQLQSKPGKDEVESLARATKADLETLRSKHASLESAVEAPTVAAKAAVEETKRLTTRTLALEGSVAAKANAADMQGVHAQLAEHAAGFHALGHEHASRLEHVQGQVAEHIAQHARLHEMGHEHARRLEQSRSELAFHAARLDGMEHRERDVQAQLAHRPEQDMIRVKEITASLIKEYYRREEIDAMMTRVWWRVGDAGKVPKGALPQLPHSLKR